MTFEEYEQSVLLDTPWRELRLPRTGRVLDVGCGSGWAVLALKGYGIDATGLDIEPVGNGSVAGTATQLPFRAASFDGAICFRVLQHISDSSTALREIARVLKPRGFLLAAIGNARAYSLLALRRGGRWTPSPQQQQYRLYDKSQIAEFLGPAGFTILSMRTCHFLPRALLKPNLDGLHRLFAGVDASLGSSRMLGGIGPLILVYARPT